MLSWEQESALGMPLKTCAAGPDGLSKGLSLCSLWLEAFLFVEMLAKRCGVLTICLV